MKFDKEIMQKLRNYQERHYIYYIKPSDKPFKIYKWLYYLTFVYNFIFGLITLLSYYVSNYNIYLLNQNNEDVVLKFTEIKNLCILIIALWIIFIAGFILNIKKHFFKGLIANLVAVLSLAFAYLKLYLDMGSDDLKQYIVRYALPLGICFILILIVGILGTRAYLKDKNAYIKFTDKDYTPQFKD